jgi:hypothetical protein
MTESERRELAAFRSAGLHLLQAEAQSIDLLDRIDSFVVQKQESILRDGSYPLCGDEEIEVAWAIGSVLGDQFVERLGWSWSLIGGGDEARYGVVSRNAALALYPSFLVQECLQEPTRDFTAYLIFNMVVAGRFDDSPAGVCIDLTAQAVRIVPR